MIESFSGEVIQVIVKSNQDVLSGLSQVRQKNIEITFKHTQMERRILFISSFCQISCQHKKEPLIGSFYVLITELSP